MYTLFQTLWCVANLATLNRLTAHGTSWSHKRCFFSWRSMSTAVHVTLKNVSHDQTDGIYTLFQTKRAKSITYFRLGMLENYTLWGGTYLYGLYMGVYPPPPPGPQSGVSLNQWNTGKICIWSDVLHWPLKSQWSFWRLSCLRRSSSANLTILQQDFRYQSIFQLRKDTHVHIFSILENVKCITCKLTLHRFRQCCWLIFRNRRMLSAGSWVPVLMCSSLAASLTRCWRFAQRHVTLAR